MLTKFEMTEEMIKMALLQRTAYDNGEKSPMQYYFDSCMEDFEVIKPFLDQNYPLKIIDIGSGIGGTNVLIYDYLKQNCNPIIFLLDKNKIDKDISYGFYDEPSVYNSFALTRQFIDINLGPSNIEITEAWPIEKFDLITSYISCGFHYPITAYLGFILNSLKDSSTVILDIRKNTGQFEILHKHFNYVDTILVGKKYKRVVCRNNKGALLRMPQSKEE